jgi:hypothetical protein
MSGSLGSVGLKSAQSTSSLSTGPDKQELKVNSLKPELGVMGTSTVELVPDKKIAADSEEVFHSKIVNQQDFGKLFCRQGSFGFVIKVPTEDDNFKGKADKHLLEESKFEESKSDDVTRSKGPTSTETQRLTALKEAYLQSISPEKQTVLSRKLLTKDTFLKDRDGSVSLEHLSLNDRKLATEIVARALFQARNSLTSDKTALSMRDQQTPRFVQFDGPQEDGVNSSNFTRVQVNALHDKIVEVKRGMDNSNDYDGTTKLQIDDVKYLGNCRLFEMQAPGSVTFRFPTGNESLSIRDIYDEFVDFANKNKLTEAEWLTLLRDPVPLPGGVKFTLTKRNPNNGDLT